MPISFRVRCFKLHTICTILIRCDNQHDSVTFHFFYVCVCFFFYWIAMVNIICYVYDFGISNAPFIQSKKICCPPFVVFARAHTIYSTTWAEHAASYNSHSLNSISPSINIIFISSSYFFVDALLLVEVGKRAEHGWRWVNEWITDYILAGSWWKSQFHLSIRKPKQQNKDCTIHIQFTFLMSVCYVWCWIDVRRLLYSLPILILHLNGNFFVLSLISLFDMHFIGLNNLAQYTCSGRSLSPPLLISLAAIYTFPVRNMRKNSHYTRFYLFIGLV